MRSLVRCLIPLFALAAVALVTLNAPTRATTPGSAEARAFTFVVTKLQYKLTNLNGLAVETKENGSVKITVEGIDLTDGDNLAFDVVGTPVDADTPGALEIGDTATPGASATSGVEMTDQSKSLNGKTLKSAKDATIAIGGAAFSIKAKYSSKKMRLTVTIKKIGGLATAEVPLTLDLDGDTKLKAGRAVTVTVSIDGGQGSTIMDTTIYDKVNKDGTIGTKGKGTPAIL